MKIIRVFLMVLSCIWSFSCMATAITEHDVIFSEQFASANTVKLNPGLNIIRGSVDYNLNNFFDWFKIELDSWLVISAINWRAENTMPGLVDERIALGFISLNALTPEAAGINIFPANSGGDFTYSSLDQIADFDLKHRFFASISGASLFDSINNTWTLYPKESGTSSYTWSFSFLVKPASAVSSPASLGLLSLGLLLLWRRLC